MAKKRPDIPHLGSPLIETHCHLDYLQGEALEDTLQKSAELGIEKIITIAVSPKNLDAVIDLATHHENVYGTLGIHPHEAKDYNQEVESKILNNLKHQHIVAVGEIGLDYHYDNSPRDIQKEVFKKQLQIAIDHNLPVVIHTREADEDTIEILKEYGPQLKMKGVFHSYTSGQELIKLALEQGFYVGFNGIVTFKNAEEVRELAKLVPLERLLLETDAPFLTPIPYRGVKNAPYYLPFVAQKLAEIKDIELGLLLDQTYKNSLKLFQL